MLREESSMGAVPEEGPDLRQETGNIQRRGTVGGRKSVGGGESDLTPLQGLRVVVVVCFVLFLRQGLLRYLWPT